MPLLKSASVASFVKILTIRVEGKMTADQTRCKEKSKNL
jgi:hypothetical protein